MNICVNVFSQPFNIIINVFNFKSVSLHIVVIVWLGDAVFRTITEQVKCLQLLTCSVYVQIDLFQYADLLKYYQGVQENNCYIVYT